MSRKDLAMHPARGDRKPCSIIGCARHNAIREAAPECVAHQRRARRKPRPRRSTRRDGFAAKSPAISGKWPRHDRLTRKDGCCEDHCLPRCGNRNARVGAGSGACSGARPPRRSTRGETASDRRRSTTRSASFTTRGTSQPRRSRSSRVPLQQTASRHASSEAPRCSFRSGERSGMRRTRARP